MFYDTSDLHNDEICLRLTETSEACPEKQWVPAYRFAICRPDGAEVGFCDLRVGYNERTYFGGNIGYTVYEAYRGHGYAAKACELLFRQAKKHGMQYVMISCTPENTASARTCEKVGGRLLEIADIPSDNEMYAQGKRKEMIFRVDL